MKRCLLGGVLVGLWVCLLAAPAEAALSVRVEPSAQDVYIDSFFDVFIEISDLGLGSSPSLGAFDFDITFTDSILALTGASFGDPVLGDQLDLYGFGMNPMGDTPYGGGVNLFEVSLDLPDDLDLYQADSFTLATLTFQAIGLGMSPLTLTANAFGDSWGLPLDPDVQHGSVTVIPAPGASMLGCIGLAMVGLVRRR